MGGHEKNMYTYPEVSSIIPICEICRKKEANAFKKISPEIGTFQKTTKNLIFFHKFGIQKIPKNSLCTINISYLYDLLSNYLAIV